MLKVFTLEQPEQWDTIVRSFKEYDVYWLSGYVKAFLIHGDGEPLLFYYEGFDTRGINVVMKRDVAKDGRFKGLIQEGQYYDFATPYGYGGWIIEGNNIEKLFDTYLDCINKNRIISEFVRFHPIVKNHIYACSFYKVIQLGEVVNVDLSSQTQIWNNFTSKNRNSIRKAIKNGIKIYNGRFPAIYQQFRDIYNRTMDKDNAEDYYYFSEEFYMSVLEDLPHNAQVFWAEKDGQTIAASIMLNANGRMNYHLSGSRMEYNAIAPTNLLLYEASLWGCANGYKTLNLGGGLGSGEDSLFKFKRAFNKGELYSFYIGRKVFDETMYHELTIMRAGNIKKVNFFPIYRG